nr:zinc finger, CCHC-type [Tanacetum cinerariifolium]
LSDQKRKTLGENGIDYIFVGHAEHFKECRFYVIEPNDYVSINTMIESKDAIFDENRFSSIPRPNDIILNLDGSQKDDHSNDALSETLEPCKDASWINHVEDSSSTSGCVFLLWGCVILWAFKKQTCITGSTMESEFAALVTVVNSEAYYVQIDAIAWRVDFGATTHVFKIVVGLRHMNQ